MTRRLYLRVLLAVAPLAVALFLLLLGASGIGIPQNADIFWQRVDRIIAGFAVGAALSCAGVVLQALLRNPLAEPYTLGVSSGAGLGAAAAILCGLAAVSAAAVPAVAFVAAVLTLLAVYRLARRNGPPSVYGLILSGVIVSAMCSSVLLFLVSTASTHDLTNITRWMLGSLQVTSIRLLRVCAVAIALGLVPTWLMARELNALTLGREMAHAVGIRTSLATAGGLALATLLAATAVSLAGLIGFVGLIVPHVMRALVGADHRRLIPAAALGGGVFLALCDGLAQTILPAREIPVGVITALLGGPFFLIVLLRRRQAGWVGG
jgi:iron complex transport system permease protein